MNSENLRRARRSPLHGRGVNHPRRDVQTHVGNHTMTAMPAGPDNLHERVRQILINDWDPADCARTEAARDVYNGYIPPLVDLIQSGGDETAIIDFLKGREAESMCFPALGTRHLRFVAKKLKALHAGG
jgi:hypothetical protein